MCKMRLPINRMHVRRGVQKNIECLSLERGRDVIFILLSLLFCKFHIFYTKHVF